MDEDGYKRAIAESPYDENLLHEYAKWLTSRGDHRGEYLRIEVERRSTEARLLELEIELAGKGLFTPIDPLWIDEVFPLTIRSPMVGRFYAAPTPQADAYVKIGQLLTITTSIGIIEAMKVFNEIPAGLSGIVREILVKSGEPVEYGQPIIRADRLPRLVSGG